eukprot:8928058-Ditylum_brightwellii.AAC.1
MPPKGCHSFVGLHQFDNLYKCDKLEMNAFNTICSQANCPCGGEGHAHDGFSCFFGQNHSNRKFVASYATHPTGRLDDKMS